MPLLPFLKSSRGARGAIQSCYSYSYSIVEVHVDVADVALAGYGGVFFFTAVFSVFRGGGGSKAPRIVAVALRDNNHFFVRVGDKYCIK